MSRRASTALLAVSAFALLLSAAAPAATKLAADYPTLLVSFKATNTVTVTLADGTPVGTTSGAPTSVAPGTYNISIDDAAFVADIQWHLSGPGVNLVTNMSYGEEPSETWVETFLPSSTYTWRDDNRPGTVFTFTTAATAPVGTPNSGQAAGLSSTTPQSSGKNGKAASTDVVGSGVAVKRGTLVGTVTAGGRLTLTLKGKTVGSLEAGLYTFAISDESKKAGFSVQQIKKDATQITTAAFTGKKTKTITLRAGQWFAYPTFVGKKLYFIVTAS
jgi:hypothetical protein